MQDMCIHMAIHEKAMGTTCEDHTPIEVSQVDVLDASELDGIVVLNLKAYFPVPDKGD